jgi:uncharacterized protein HemX
MEKLAGRLLVITLIIIVGLGVHVFNLQTKVEKAQATAAQAIQNRDDFRKKSDEANKAANAAQVALNTCNASLKDAEEQLAAKGKKR